MRKYPQDINTHKKMKKKEMKIRFVQINGHRN